MGGASNLKNKGTLLSSTFKVEEKKVPLFFWIWDLWAEIWPFCHFYESDDLEPNQEKEKRVIYLPRGLQSKKKGTLLSSTFKVEEKKVPLFLDLGHLGSD